MGVVRSIIILIASLFLMFSGYSLAHDVAKITLEEPVDSGIASGISNIRGWAISDTGVEKIELFVNGRYVSDIPYGGQRLDVESAYPNVPDSIHSGFGQTFNYGELGSGSHEITVRAYLGDGLLIEDTARFKASVLPTPFIPESEKPDLSGASVTLDRTTGKVLISEVELTSGETFDLTIDWATAKQGFKIVDVNEAEVESTPSGTVVFIDGEGVVLGEAINGSIIELDGFEGSFFNDHQTGTVRLSGVQTYWYAYYKSEDCTGPAYVRRGNDQINDIEGTLYVRNVSDEERQLLLRSRKHSIAADFSLNVLREISGCEAGSFSENVLPARIYTPPSGIRNAAYPVTLEQTP